MKKKTVVSLLSICLVIVALLVAYSVPHVLHKRISTVAFKNNPPVVDVDAVIKNPGKFKGFLRVAGTVIDINRIGSLFTLGCEDACITMPVRYTGDLPTIESKVIVSGEIIKDAGKYLFEANSVETQ